jgi:5'(3')-deoxyribonucleotidase
MTNLVSILTAETKSLKEQYIDFTYSWAASDFTKKTEWLKEYYVFMDTKYRNKEYMAANRVYFNPEYREEYLSKYRDQFDNMPKEIISGDIEKYIEKQVEKAKKHYANSIIKLASRVQQKGLNQDKIKATTSHIGVNIDTILTDGDKSVKAFTILAHGEINRPHYRYLIK